MTRWGRFQDVDESAYYEFLCKRAGVRVHYCAEPFNNSEGSTMAALFKSLKRAMAGEYLRELSHKVFVGQERIARMGYKLGGAAGYGLRRELVSRDGIPKGILNHHEWKSLSSDRVRYVLGPPEEVAVVRQIFELFVNEGLWAPQIVKRLNDLGIPCERGQRWTQTVVSEMLKHPKYMGTMVYNRISKKLGANTTRNPCSKYIVIPNTLPAIVTSAMFQAAQCRLLPPRDLSDQELLDGLRRVLERNGRLSMDIIDSSPDVPGAQTYQRRFGNLGTAYKLVGYTGCDRLTSFSEGAHYLRRLRSRVEGELCLALHDLGCPLCSGWQTSGHRRGRSG